MAVEIFPSLGALPLFNPEIEAEAPRPVRELWDAVTAADAVLIASPEYAHGMTGTIKNALDWLVGHPPFYGKPVAVFNPALHSHHADAGLRETLRTMSVDLIEGASLRIPVNGSGLDAAGIAARAPLRAAIFAALVAIEQHLATRPAQSESVSATDAKVPGGLV